MNPCIVYTQHLSSARGIALGGFTSLSSGVASFDWNPAALVFTQDWDLSLSNYLSTGGATGGFAFHSTTIAKRFLENHAAALRYSPGKITEFVIPTAFRFVDSNVVIQTTFDQKISYQEPFAIGYAYRMDWNLAVGAAARFTEEKVSDTEYFLDSTSIIRSRTRDFQGTSWAFDLGVHWSASPMWKLGVVIKNLFTMRQDRLPDAVGTYRLAVPRFFRLGVGYAGLSDVVLGLDGDTEKRFRIGVEWKTNVLSARGGFYGDVSAHPVAEAVAFGIGGTYEFVEFEASYLKFLSQKDRAGSADLSRFNVSDIRDVEYNPFTSDRISLTVHVTLGQARKVEAHIEGVELLNGIHPASSLMYAYTPLGRAHVRNISGKPIKATVSFYTDGLMDTPTESKPVTILPGDRQEILFYAIFDERIKSVQSTTIREGTVAVTAQAVGGYDDRYQAHLLIHGRNDWNGNAAMLKYFITPSDPAIVQFTRSVLSEQKDGIDSVAEPLRNFARARVLFDEFAKRITYVNDPRESRDYVQYPSETLNLRGGDCDDLTVSYSTILMSVGIPVAFIDVVPPDRPQDAHIYVMFDSGIEARNAQLLGENPKRFVLRKNPQAKETLWIPIETTVTTKGFDEAWTVGAKEFFDDAEINFGLSRGWVKIVDVQTIF